MLFNYTPHRAPIFKEDVWDTKRYELGLVRVSGVAVFAVHELVNHQKPKAESRSFDDDEDDEDTPEVAEVVSREYHLCNVLPGHTWLVAQCKDLQTCLSKIEGAVEDLASRTAALQLAFSSARYHVIEGSPHPHAEHIHQWADGAKIQMRLVPNPLKSAERDKEDPPVLGTWITMKNIQWYVQSPEALHNPFVHEYRAEPKQEPK